MIQLQIGDSGETVEQLNTWLKSMDYYITDNNFTARTQTAVKSFQNDHGIKISGVVDEETWDKLGSLNAAAPEILDEAEEDTEDLPDQVLDMPEESAIDEAPEDAHIRRKTEEMQETELIAEDEIGE